MRRLLEANPEERRLIFEEAAGISKFKARKKETQRKLEKVDQNLLRVTDIVEEVEKRLRSVKVQAGRARTFQEHQQRLSELRLMYALQEYHTHHTQVGELDTRSTKTRDFALTMPPPTCHASRMNWRPSASNSRRLPQKRQQLEYDLVQAGAALQSARQRQQYARQQFSRWPTRSKPSMPITQVAEQKLAEVEQNAGQRNRNA